MKNKSLFIHCLMAVSLLSASLWAADTTTTPAPKAEALQQVDSVQGTPAEQVAKAQPSEVVQTTNSSVAVADGAVVDSAVVNSAAADSAKGFYTKIIDWYNEHLSYGTITLLMAVESSFIPFPSELVVPPAAYQALQPDSDLNIVLIVLFATLGAMLGAFANYYLAKFLGRPIIYKFANSRLGHFFLIDAQKVEKAENYFRDHGVISTFVGRLIPVIRQLISIPAGLSGMKILPFALYTLLGAVIWNTVLVVLGYVANGQKDLIEKYNSELAMVLVGLGVLFIGFMFYKALKPKKKEATDNSSAENSADTQK